MNQIMKEIGNIWEYKVGINVIIASFCVCVKMSSFMPSQLC